MINSLPKESIMLTKITLYTKNILINKKGGSITTVIEE